jgi:polysaccharide biosynthesis/export protein
MVMKRATLSLLMLGVAACSGPKYVQSPDVRVIQASEMPAPTAADAVAENQVYVIGANDLISVDVYNLAEVTREVRVDSEGRVSLPLAGTMNVAGRTLNEVQEMVRDRLRASYVRDPKVAVNVREFASRTIALDGEVDRPGVYPVIGRLTMIRAVALAQGTSDFAQDSNVVVLRTVNGQEMAAVYNLGAIRAGAYKDPEVFARDRIIVGDSQVRRLLPQLVQAGAVLVSPIIALLR